MAESLTCDESYSDNGTACAFYNFGCDDVKTSSLTIPTCFNGLAQSPIDLEFSSATVEDPGQVTFSGYNDQLGLTPFLRLEDFTVQLDFNQERQRLRQRRKKKRPRKKKRLRKENRKKKSSLKRLSREANLPSISGGALGENR